MRALTIAEKEKTNYRERAKNITFHTRQESI